MRLMRRIERAAEQADALTRSVGGKANGHALSVRGAARHAEARDGITA